MSFILFFLFYIISTFILFIIGFVLYKLVFKKMIYSKLVEDALLKAFESEDYKSILDVEIPAEKEEEKDNEKVYTYF